MIYIYIYIHTCVYIHIYKYMYIYIYVFLHPDTLVVESACLDLRVSFEHRSKRKSCLGGGAGLSNTRGPPKPSWLALLFHYVSKIREPQNLGGGNSHIFFHFHPEPWGRMNESNLPRTYFSVGWLKKNHQLASCLVGWKNLQVKLKDSMAKDEELREELEDVKVLMNS